MLRLRIKEVAERKGYNMSSLSRKSDVSFKTVKRLWKDPYQTANTDTLERLATALGVDVRELLESVPDTKQNN
jgi:DNA-binding Xre family transcriptional regulator